MSSYWAFIYGIIQGITEFLPISSSGHLALLPKLFKVGDPGVFFDLMMHLGTALSIIVYFHKDILVLIKQFSSMVTKSDKDSAFAMNFLITTIATVLPVLILMQFNEYFRRPIPIGIMLIVFGFFLYYMDRKGRDIIDLSVNKDIRGAIIVGALQSLAVFPGVSRSGITITAGRMIGMSRENAGRYSFLMSLPLIFGGIILKLKDLKSFEAVETVSLLIGVVVSFIVGIICIHYFLKLIKNIGMGVFFGYRVILGVIIIIMYW